MAPNKADVPARLESDLEFLDKAYPDIDIEFVYVKGEFSPQLIESLCKKWNILTNLMFVGSPGHHFLRGISALGGVRLIT